jgi:hypothetical protein
MRTLTCIIALFLTIPGTAFAGDIAPIKAGQPAPADGVFMDVAKAAQIAAEAKACQVERDGYKAELSKPHEVVGSEQSLMVPIILTGTAAVVIGGVTGFFIGRAVYKSK